MATKKRKSKKAKKCKLEFLCTKPGINRAFDKLAKIEKKLK
jgi:hypothetical protein